jgi:hypothetical protein
LAIVVSTFEPRRTHPLYWDLLGDATFYELLLACDRDLADTARCAGCARCSGVVHSAPYWRKPRGRPCRLGREHDLRFSFCCAADGCRSRATPPSLRFLGPKVYIAAIVVLIAILRHGATARRMRELDQVIGVDRRTVERWRRWWRDSFTTTSFWQIARALFMPPVDQNRLPAALIERFAPTAAPSLDVRITFTCRLASSIANSYMPSEIGGPPRYPRYSMTTLWPSTYPASFKPWRKDAPQRFGPFGPLARNPITGISLRCACVTSGHAAALTPAMNSRRLIMSKSPSP